MTSTLPRTEARSGTMGGERKGWVEQAALVAFIAVPFLAIVVAVAVATWVVIAAQKTAATKPQDKLALGESELQAISAPREPENGADAA